MNNSSMIQGPGLDSTRGFCVSGDRSSDSASPPLLSPVVCYCFVTLLTRYSRRFPDTHPSFRDSGCVPSLTRRVSRRPSFTGLGLGFQPQSGPLVLIRSIRLVVPVSGSQFSPRGPQAEPTSHLTSPSYCPLRWVLSLTRPRCTGFCGSCPLSRTSLRYYR